MGSINYKKLYDLQDKVLDIVFSVEDMFYLTGGTCISRFYQEKGYSDDLDFFADDEPRFKAGILLGTSGFRCSNFVSYFLKKYPNYNFVR